MKQMLSRTNFIVISLMMVVLMGLFQFTQIVKTTRNVYDENAYVSDWTQKEADCFVATESDPYVLYVGNAQSASAFVVKQWTTYTKRGYVIWEEEISNEFPYEKLPEVVVVDGTLVKTEAQVTNLLSWTMKGIHLIFAGLPDVNFIENSEGAKRLLGIGSVSLAEKELQGIRVLEGFLLGGEHVYAYDDKEEERMDLTMTVPWYVTRSGTKTYIVGEIEYEMEERNYLPAILWRSSVNNAKVFSVNGNYLDDIMGIGFLDSMMAELHSYEIYPVINAQVLSVVDFPNLSASNEEQMMDLYSRGQKWVYRDIVWPDLLSTMASSEFRMTCFMSTGEEPSKEELIFYLRQMKEQEAEMGKAFVEEINPDYAFFNEAQITYDFSAAYVSKEQYDLSKLGGYDTIVTTYNEQTPLIGYVGEETLLMGITTDVFSYTYTEDLRLRALQTALAYSNTEVNLTTTIHPTVKDHRWEHQSDTISSVLNTYWDAYEEFRKMTVSEAAKEARNFLSLSFDDSRNGNRITLNVKNTTMESSFLLHIHEEEIVSIEGAEAVLLEDGVYLLTVKEPKVVIEVKEKAEVHTK